ncbi:MAG: peptidylprolyl isomerase [Cyclobacteriaceae bacterium]|nr:peptidylprolyl isomerase [Cyclobacteriaceae bacterium]
MKLNFNKLVHEPLVHFLLIGAAIFVFYGLTRDVASEAPNRIVVTQGQQEQLVANFNRTWLRPPSKDELAGLVDNYVREEVFYREAMAMGLDQDDPMVRRRMRMKLEFILEDLSSETVADADLVAFLQKHPEKFRAETQLSFQQVYLDPKKRMDIEADAKELLTRLNNGVAADSVGDSTLSPYEYKLVTQSDIKRSLGEGFAIEVNKLSPGDWTGPIYSAYGAHLLKVSERIEARLPELAEIRDLVKREYLVVLKQQQKDFVYKKLRDNYEVTVEPVSRAQVLESNLLSAAQVD